MPHPFDPGYVVLVLGQDPAQHETIVRRILVGEAGRRLQGLLARLGITRSYVFINTFLYSVYGSVKAATRRSPALVEYRNRWLQALLVGQQVEVATGTPRCWALRKGADELAKRRNITITVSKGVIA